MEDVSIICRGFSLCFGLCKWYVQENYVTFINNLGAWSFWAPKERRSMTSRRHGRTISGWQQNQRGRWKKENGKKVKGFYGKNNNFARASRFFVHFFAVVAPPATWNFLISHACFMEQVDTTQKLSFSSTKLRYCPFGFNPRKFRQHLPN